MDKKNNATIGWGIKSDEGAEIWDDHPLFLGDTVTRKDWAKLLFYPKKWMLYRALKKEQRKTVAEGAVHFRVLDVGCGTGAAVIDMKKMFGKHAEVKGIDVVQLQIEIAQQKIQAAGVWAEFAWYDGVNIPYPDNHFDAMYTSDVLGHVADVHAWLEELQRVLKPGGTLAMFSESQLGKHAYIRKYLFDRGVNVDPHAEFHISLYPKKELRHMIERAGFVVNTMKTTFWATFFVHPDECYPALHAQERFVFLKAINTFLYWIKKKTHPFSTALAGLYGLVEMYVVGSFVEAQGYVILAKKKKRS